MPQLRSAIVAAVFIAFVACSPALSARPQDAEKAKPARKALLLTGANNHRWKETTPHLEKLLEEGGYFDVEVSDDPEAPVLSDARKLAGFDVIVLNFNRSQRWTAEREANFLKFVKDGGGLVVVHASDNAFPGWEDYDRLVGGTWRSKGSAFPQRGTFHPPYGDFEVAVVDDKHPITAGLGSSFATRDEMYTNLKLQDNIHVLAQGTYEGKPQPLIFVSNYGKGRMFQTALGHDLPAMMNPKFKDTLIRGARWAARQLNAR